LQILIFSFFLLGYDLLNREVDAQTGVMTSSRVIVKKGKLPSWGQGFMKKPEAIVLEDTEVDPKAKVLVAKTRNINYTKVMSVIEVMHIKVHPDNDQWCVGQFHHSLFPLSPFAKDLTPPFFRSFRSFSFVVIHQDPGDLYGSCGVQRGVGA